jgi:hypothetical protein
MTLTVATSLGKIKVTPSFRVTAAIKRKIKESLKLAVGSTGPVDALLGKIKKEIPWSDSPRGTLVAYMTGQGWSQKRLSKATGIPQGHLSQMVNGKRPIGPTIAKKLAKVFRVDYRNFL